jgi:hypothetical protein
MPRTYENHSAERWPLIETLLGLGFTLDQVAQVGGFSKATIRNDLHDHGGTTESLFPDRPKDPAVRYRLAFQRYAGLPDGNSPRTPLEQQLYQALETLLELRRMRDYLDGVLAVDRRFTTLHASEPGDQPWAEFAQMLMGKQTCLSEELFWFVVQGARDGEFVPSSPKDPGLLESLDVDELRQMVLPLATPERLAPLKAFVTKVVDVQPGEVERSLTEAESRVIVIRYGLDGDSPQTLEETGMILRRTRESIRIIEKKALRKLRARRELLDQLRPYAQAAPENSRIAMLKAYVLELNKRLNGHEPSDLYVGELSLEVLDRRCEDLDMSVRTANCLQNARIEQIGQLIQLTESQLLQSKNFGRKSLNEVKELLSEFGLRLGIILPPELARYPVSHLVTR